MRTMLDMGTRTDMPIRICMGGTYTVGSVNGFRNSAIISGSAPGGIPTFMYVHLDLEGGFVALWALVLVCGLRWILGDGGGAR